jgi:hypothetical protein
MRQISALLALVLVLTACKKEKSNDNSSLNSFYGRYTGTFNRSGLDTSHVDLYFKDDKSFEGSSDRTNYPAICDGKFQLNGTSLMADDTCSWTANFDWTLIFDGNYTISFSDNNSVRVWRTNGTITDEYNLRKITR